MNIQTKSTDGMQRQRLCNQLYGVIGDLEPELRRLQPRQRQLMSEKEGLIAEFSGLQRNLDMALQTANTASSLNLVPGDGVVCRVARERVSAVTGIAAAPCCIARKTTGSRTSRSRSPTMISNMVKND